MNAPPLAKQAAFNRKALSYDAHAFVQRDAAEWLAEWLPQDTHPGRCLELGAGTGLFTSHLQGHFQHLEISDVSPEMLEVCNQRVPGIHQRARDAWAEPSDPKCWDFLASSSLLQWAPEPTACLINWKKLLRPNGRVLAGFFAQPSLPEMTEILDGGSPVHWHASEEWVDFFDSAALNIERIETDTRRYEYESPLHFWKSLHGTGATVSQRMTPSQMFRLFKDYESRFSTPDGGVYATWTFCRVELS
jgi:Methylase involved in ubiquinone/menaquinone biosynthesis